MAKMIKNMFKILCRGMFTLISGSNGEQNKLRGQLLLW